MSLLVTGSIGIDTVETPHGRREDVIGGSAVYFSYAASFFSHVRLVGVVGDDQEVVAGVKRHLVGAEVTARVEAGKATRRAAADRKIVLLDHTGRFAGEAAAGCCSAA